MARTTKSRAEVGLANAQKLIESRRPESADNTTSFRLKEGVNLLIKPKFIFTDEDGNRVHVRYASVFNSIFVDEQHETSSPVKMEYISMTPNMVVRDGLLRDFLLLHPQYGKMFYIVDPVGQAKEEMTKLEAFYDVWDEVRALPAEGLKSLCLLLTPMTLHQMRNMSVPELRLSLHAETKRDPSRVKESINDPVNETLYLYHMGLSLEIIKYIPRRGAIVWTDSDKEICKVPVNKDPGMYFAKLILTDEYIKVRELLEQRMND